MKREFILYAVIAVLAFLQLRQCNSNIGPDENPDGIDTVSVIHDTLYLPGVADTTPPPVRERIVYRDRPAEITASGVDSVSGDSIKTYTTQINDSLIDATITTDVYASGGVFTNFSYLAKFPQYIRVTDTLRITKEVTIKKRSWSLHAGGVIGGNTQAFSLQPVVLVQNRKGSLYGAGYDVIQKTYNLHAYFKVKNPFSR